MDNSYILDAKHKIDTMYFFSQIWDLNMHLNALKEVAVVPEHVALIIAGLLKWILDM